jgi:hypothetical protein
MAWKAIVVTDPALLLEATGDQFNTGELFSFGTVVADDAILTARGLEAVDLAGQPDFAVETWDPKSRVMVPLAGEDLAAALDIKIADLQSQLDDLMVQKEAVLSDIAADIGPSPVVVEES